MENLILDNLSFANDKDILKTTNNEKLLFSDNIIKINRYNMSQERTFLITEAAVYNLKKKSLKRKIELKNIRGITISNLTDEFVIHGLEIEYDYHYVSAKRNSIVQILAQAFSNLTKKELKLCQVNDNSLKNYVTQKKEKKKEPTFSRMDETKLININ